MRHAYVFGPFVLDAKARELSWRRQTLALHPRSFDVLAALVERAGSTVSRAELLETLWPHQSVLDANLSQHIFVIRRTLAECDPSRRYIATIAGKGYRFDAGVHSLEERSRLHPEAVRAYVLGRYLATYRTQQRLESALACFRRALAIEPAFAAAHAALADAHLLLGQYLFHPFDEACSLAQTAATRALAVEEHADARAVLGDIALFYDRNAEAAIAHYELGARSNPLAPSILTYRMWHACITGDDATAQNRCDALVAREPCSPAAQMMLGVHLIFARAFSEAAAVLQNVAAMDPRFEVATYYRAMALALAGAHDDAVSAIAAWRTGEFIEQRASMLGFALGLAGRPNAARRYERDCSDVNRAIVGAGRGDGAHACAHLERAIARRDPWLVFTWRHPIFDRLRGTRRFERIVKRSQQPLARGA
jgi:DNA-binding winged helix-turn-helix (wHTH) protein